DESNAQTIDRAGARHPRRGDDEGHRAGRVRLRTGGRAPPRRGGPALHRRRRHPRACAGRECGSRHMACDGRPAVPHAPGGVRAAAAQGAEPRAKRRRHRRVGREGRDRVQAGRRGLRRGRGRLRRVRRGRSEETRPEAGEPLLRAGGGRSHLGDDRAAGRARPGKGRGRAEGADHRGIGRRGHVRRSDRQGLRRRSHRRVQHGEGGPGSSARRRPRRRLQPGGSLRRRAPLRRHPRHGRQSTAVTAPPSAHPRREAGHRRWRERRTVDRGLRPRDPGSAAVSVRRPEARQPDGVGELRGPDGPPGPSRGGNDHIGHRSDVPLGRRPRGDPAPDRRTRPRQGRHHRV
ncbi:MAG: Bifunctional protein: zinc-containing alcohol dehydrogenase; quinone oxidoreductase (NADPH:quinone reductase); Similar to arginate lyase, partial [uncultured Acidimicrobiales bacterium]